MKEVKNPIKGGWYKTISGSYVKYSHTEEGVLYYTERIDRATKVYMDCLDWLATPLYEADMDEVRAYLPDGHPDNEFPLPHVWHIIVTRDNIDPIMGWAIQNGKHGDGSSYEVGEVILCSKDRLIHSIPMYLLTHFISIGYNFGTELTTEQFYKYVLKKEEMKKMEYFTIEGTDALVDAFIKDSGFSVSLNSGGNEAPYKNLTSSGIDSCMYTFHRSKENKHFILPQQWDEAMSYVKLYFAQQKEHVIELNDGMKAVVKADKVVIGDKAFDRKTLCEWLNTLSYSLEWGNAIPCNANRSRILIDINVGKLVDVERLGYLREYLNRYIYG